jgi:sigma-E factor negative regulatory protein RseA
MSLNPSEESRRSALSALMDGEASAADEACRAWRDDRTSRAHWHAYHLIGDLLRSEEHRCDAAHDADFVARLRQRLADEPALPAPQPLQPVASTGVQRARTWMAPAAVAAGFIAVAGALVVTRVSAPDGDTGDRNALAAAPAATSVRPVALQGGSASQAGSGSTLAPENAGMIRNAELDRYLAAHRQFANASTVAAPGGVMRSAAVAAPGR